MPKGKAKSVKKYERLLKKPDTKESKFDELEHKLSEDKRESDDGLSIEDEEDAGEEIYPETEELGYEDDSRKEDE